VQTILLVDDEVDILDSLKPVLESHIEDVEVRTAESGAQALDLLRKAPVDLILSDYKMPGMNGLDFLDQASRIAPGTPRILITAFPDLDIAIRAINEAGIEHFITKPFETDRVVEQVRAALFKRRVEGLWKDSLARSIDALRGKTASGP
jgi:response regulator RpfG family c-di-GMP phosphodiesterase